MDKVFLCIDQQEINNKVAPVKTAIAEFKPFYERYKALNLKEMVTTDLHEFIYTPKTFFLNVLTGGESLKIGQLQLDPEKVYDLSPRPVGVDELVSDITKKINDYSIQRNYLGQVQNMEIVKNELIVSTVYVSEIKQMFTYYAETEDQKTALNLLIRVSEDLTKLQTLRKQDIYGEGNFVENILRGGNGTLPYLPNLKTILAF